MGAGHQRRSQEIPKGPVPSPRVLCCEEGQSWADQGGPEGAILLSSKGQGTILVPNIPLLVLHLHKWPHGVSVFSCFGWRSWTPALSLPASCRVLPNCEKTSPRLGATWLLGQRDPMVRLRKNS